MAKGENAEGREGEQRWQAGAVQVVHGSGR